MEREQKPGLGEAAGPAASFSACLEPFAAISRSRSRKGIGIVLTAMRVMWPMGSQCKLSGTISITTFV